MAVVAVHTHSDRSETQPSDTDLAQFLYTKERLLSFVVSPRDRGPTNIDVLVKCQETDLIGNREEYNQVIANSERHLVRFGEKFGEKIIRGIIPLRLVDWRRFVAILAEAYRVGYYSSFDYLSLTHQELVPGEPIRLTKVYPPSSLDDFLTSPQSKSGI